MLRIGETVDRYVIEALIGQGGMAAVYRARHSTLDSLHAIKVLFITAPEIRTRLMREGKVQANLRHQNIVAVTDVLEVQGSPALVMEYIDGPPLDQWLSHNRPTLEEALFLFRGLLRGVMAAHERGVIHRDLKPANVLLAPTNEGVIPKVADFGLTKSIKSTKGQTQTGLAMGTPEYMAPEQIRDSSDVDERVDMFALGCILYEMVCHQRAFEGPDNVTVFNAIVNGTYTPPKELAPDLPRNIATAIKWLLESDRDKRLASAVELFDLLYDEQLGPQLNMGPAPSEPIPISTTIVQPTPIPAPQAQVITEPPPMSRQMTPAGAVRVTPRGSDAPTQIPHVGATQPLQVPSGDRGFIRLLAPLVVVAAAAFFVGIAYNQVSAVGAVGSNATPQPRPDIAVAPTPSPGDGQITVEAPTPAPQPVEVPVPVAPAPEPAQPRPQVPKPPSPQPSGTPTPTPTPDPVPVPAPEAPAPAPRSTGTDVALTGDVAKVWLVNGTNRFAIPGQVPAGPYQIEADFGDGPVPAGNSVRVREGSPVRIECIAFAYKCVPK